MNDLFLVPCSSLLLSVYHYASSVLAKGAQFQITFIHISTKTIIMCLLCATSGLYFANQQQQSISNCMLWMLYVCVCVYLKSL